MWHLWTTGRSRHVVAAIPSFPRQLSPFGVPCVSQSARSAIDRRVSRRHVHARRNVARDSGEPLDSNRVIAIDSGVVAELPIGVETPCPHRAVVFDRHIVVVACECDGVMPPGRDPRTSVQDCGTRHPSLASVHIARCVVPLCVRTHLRLSAIGATTGKRARTTHERDVGEWPWIDCPPSPHHRRATILHSLARFALSHGIETGLRVLPRRTRVTMRA